MNKSVIIRQDFVLAFHFQALVILFFGAGLLTTFFANPTLVTVIAVFLISVIPILLALSRHYVRLDVESQQVMKSVKVLGFQIRGKHYEFHQIERLFLNRVNVSQRLSSLVGQREFKDELFKSFIKFHDGEKWFLDVDHNYEELKKRTLGYQKVVWAPFFDNFQNEVIQ